MVGPSSLRSVALFVTSHGFGHASRGCAVAKALTDEIPCKSTKINTLANKLIDAHCELENLPTARPAHRQQTLNNSLQAAQLISELL